ncbi:hypothetical protein, partial [Yoonia sp. R2-816]|uniref:hypothetical protein n=1 Tax=Yoonia sp. R2-816 TaxID=3342638 RepID=UPI00372D2400
MRERAIFRIYPACVSRMKRFKGLFCGLEQAAHAKKAGPPVMAGLFVGWGVCLVDVEWFGRDDFTVDLDQGDHVAGLGQA